MILLDSVALTGGFAVNVTGPTDVGTYCCPSQGIVDGSNCARQACSGTFSSQDASYVDLGNGLCVQLSSCFTSASSATVKLFLGAAYTVTGGTPLQSVTKVILIDCS